MSYDLFIRGRNRALTPECVWPFFQRRAHYRVEGGAIYANQSTGVYFTCSLSGEMLHVALNYVRPSAFALEAAIELREIIAAFDAVVEDPQIGGMGEGEYVEEKFLSGYATGNRFSVTANAESILRQLGVAYGRASRDKIERTWRWNYGVAERQRELGERGFVPRFMYLVEPDGDVRSAVTWGDAIPTLLPVADRVIVGRERLAKRSLFGKPAKEFCLVDFAVIAEAVQPYAERLDDGTLTLLYGAAPPPLEKMIRRLTPVNGKLSLLAFDHVLDRELVPQDRHP